MTQPRNPPGVQALKAHGWRLDARMPPDAYRMLPPSGTRTASAEVLTDAQCLEKAQQIQQAKDQAALATAAEKRRLETIWQPGQPDEDWEAEARARIAEAEAESGPVQRILAINRAFRPITFTPDRGVEQVLRGIATSILEAAQTALRDALQARGIEVASIRHQGGDTFYTLAGAVTGEWLVADMGMLVGDDTESPWTEAEEAADEAACQALLEPLLAHPLPADFDTLGQRLEGIGWVGAMPDGAFTLRHVDGIEYLFDADQWAAVCDQAEEWIARASAPSPAPDLPTPPSGWAIWQDTDTTYGMMHECGIKLRGASPDRLIADAQEASRWIAHLAGWHVSLDIAGNDWQASHETWGQVFAPDLPRLALAAWRTMQATADLPDLPNDLIDAAFLAGWVFLSQGAGRSADRVYYDLPGGIRAHFSPGEMRHELGISALAAPDHVFRRPASVPPQMDIKVATLVPGRFQPRQTFDDAGLSELADSIREYGVLTRLKVFVNENELFELIAGERRLRAATLAGLETVPCDICEYTLAQVHEISIVDNLQRADLSPLEEGAAYERLIAELQISEAALSKRVGKSRGYIQQRRALAAADPSVQKALTEGKITFTQARVLTQGAPAHAAQRKALKALTAEQESGRRVTETQAQEIAARASLDDSKKALSVLGWAYDTRYTGGECIVWAAGERPSVWTGAEIAQVVREGRVPQTAHLCEAGTLTEDERTILGQVGDWHTNHEVFAPWIFVHNRSTRLWVTIDEARAMAETARHERATMAACYAVAGWSLTNDRAWSVWTVVSPQGRTETLIGWEAVQAHYQAVQAGTATTEPDAVPTHPCRVCGQPIEGHYTPDTCAACKAQIQERRERWQAELALRWGPWLEAGPRDALIAVAHAAAQHNTTLFCGQWMTHEQLAQWVVALSADELAARLVHWAAQTLPMGE